MGWECRVGCIALQGNLGFWSLCACVFAPFHEVPLVLESTCCTKDVQPLNYDAVNRGHLQETWQIDFSLPWRPRSARLAAVRNLTPDSLKEMYRDHEMPHNGNVYWCMCSLEICFWGIFKKWATAQIKKNVNNPFITFSFNWQVNHLNRGLLTFTAWAKPQIQH